MRRSRAIRRLRWLVLLAMFGAVVAVVLLYMSGRDDPAGGGDSVDDIESRSLEPTGEMEVVGEGFERTVTEENRQLFTIRGERYSLNREGVVFLEGVEVVIYRDEGGEYQVRGDRARFEVEQQQGRIAGGVRVTAPDGLNLTTESLVVTRGAREIRSRQPVAFELGEEYHGTAEGLRAWIEPRRYELQGLVEIDSRPGAEEPLHIQAKGLILDRNRSLLRSRDWAILKRRGERLSALEMHFFFAEDERTLLFVRAERKVSGLLRSGGSVDLEGVDARRIGFRAGKMTLLMSEDGRHPRQLDLEGQHGVRPQVYTLGPPSAARYRLSAPTITAWFDDAGNASRALAEGPADRDVVLVMLEPGERGVDEAGLGAQPTPEEEEAGAGSREPEAEAEEAAEAAGPTRRRALARQAEASFTADGELREVEMRVGVVLEDDQLLAEGDRGVFRVMEEQAELQGNPAVATGEQGVLEAPRILYTRDSGLVHGAGGVRARIDEARESPLAGSPLARGDGPVMVEAEQGYLRDKPRTFLFVGNVRAWRDDDLLVTEELRGDEAEDRLTATGGVRTLWNPEADEGGPCGGDSARGRGDQAPIEVTSDSMVYRQGERLLVYTGTGDRRVRAEQDGRTIVSREMELTLAQEGGLERLVATGAVEVDAPPPADDPDEAGKHLTGERAVYDPEARTIDVTAAEGGKVTLKDGDGNVVEGPRMEYDIDTDRVRMVGREATAPTVPPAGDDG
jgi:LPS export ABC transporter protein LptC